MVLLNCTGEVEGGQGGTGGGGGVLLGGDRGCGRCGR